jgi:hypothetical protein
VESKKWREGERGKTKEARGISRYRAFPQDGPGRTYDSLERLDNLVLFAQNCPGVVIDKVIPRKSRRRGRRDSFLRRLPLSRPGWELRSRRQARIQPIDHRLKYLCFF